MHQVDYQLGLYSAGEDEYENADGKVLLAACNTKCTLAHPFSKTKRDACKQTCATKFEVRQETGKILGVNKYLKEQEGAAAGAESEAAEAASIDEENITTGKRSKESSETETAGGLGTGAMIGIGVGAVVIIGLVGYLVMRK